MKHTAIRLSDKKEFVIGTDSFFICSDMKTGQTSGYVFLLLTYAGNKNYIGGYHYHRRINIFPANIRLPAF